MHYKATFVHQFPGPRNPATGMVIEGFAPSPTDAAEALFTVAAAIPHRTITGIDVLEPLAGLPMSVGDLAVVTDIDHPEAETVLRCGIAGWNGETHG